ncbi:MAG: aspartyl-phosphate phosphatase Spo0E family protein [Eubacterium sp.]
MKEKVRALIEHKRQELDKAMEEKDNYEKVLKLSIQLDECINEYMRMEA